ncbi:MAG: SpoIID/LytB domain-containing protein [Clostridiales bacterium]|nr:SpoIID/LytB domain-containing protein [Clostridiales bacterium]
MKSAAIYRSALRRILLLLLCVALGLPHAALAAGSKKSSVNEIRVLLTRLNLTNEAWMTLEGRYLARGSNGTEVLLPVGAQITVFLRNGQLALFHDGLSVNAGTELQLLRQEDGDIEPGIRFNLYAGVYPGNLTLSVQDGSIRPILKLPLEKYLLGVVPYEMSDSFPLEALKVQAICARTYALSRMNQNRSAEWDLVDNTNDQVFRGTPAQNENSSRAIEETAGLVLTYKDKLITAWYSASNGGQTELPGNIWNGKDIPGCFAMTDDPWDAQNPDSTVRTAVLGRDGSGLSRGMLRLLYQELAKKAELSGRLPEKPEDLKVDAIRSVKLTTPRYASPSRLMTRMEITLDAFSGTYDAALDLFPEAVFYLGLSVYGANNEIISVSEDEKGFTLTAGRYGHGVGMSQRGAQYMASEGKKTFKQILDFYYPGVTIKRYRGEADPLPTPDPVLCETPGPVPTATPRPTLMPVTEELPEGAWLATVEHIDDDSTLNLREKPSAGAKIVRRLYKHQQLAVLEEADVIGWLHVKTDVTEGYVMASFLTPVE